MFTKKLRGIKNPNFSFNDVHKQFDEKRTQFSELGLTEYLSSYEDSDVAERLFTTEEAAIEYADWLASLRDNTGEHLVLREDITITDI